MAALLLAGCMSLFAQPDPPPGPVPIPSTELRIFPSEIMGQAMRIHVQLPLDYVPGGSRKYPVWYMTDANRHFPMVANISTLLGFPPGRFPQVIVVGIGYEIRSMGDWAAWRTRDLTPVPHAPTEAYWTRLLRGMTGDTAIRVETGRSGRFLDFICEELVPFIENTYPVNPEERTLGGYSYGGLFSVYSLFERPGFFSRYYCGSPSLHYAQGRMFAVEEAFAETHQDLPAKVFLSAGGREDSAMISHVRRMAEQLESRHYPGLEVRLEIIEGEGHASAAPASITRGFQVLYGEK